MRLSLKKLIEILKKKTENLNTLPADDPKELLAEEVPSEDKEDSDTLYSILVKIDRDPSAALTSKEKEVLEKYNLQRAGYTLYLKNLDGSSSIDGDLTLGLDSKKADKVNYADKARKLADRLKNRIFYNKYGKPVGRVSNWNNKEAIERAEMSYRKSNNNGKAMQISLNHEISDLEEQIAMLTQKLEILKARRDKRNK